MNSGKTSSRTRRNPDRLRHAARIALSALVLTGPAPAAEPPPSRFDVVPFNPSRAAPAGGNGSRRLDNMECLTEPHLIANVGSPVEGTLSEVLVDRGARVTKGQIVARLNSAVEAATVNLRAAQEEFGKRKVERNEELFNRQLISANEKDELETQTRIAGLELRQQQEILALRTIRSPIDGVVVERSLAPGDRVANDKIVKIAQVDPLNVEVVAPVEVLGAIRVGMVGEIRFQPLLQGVYRARVVVVDPVVDAASGTFGVRLELPNPENRIPAGVKCRVRFTAK
jgi:RND family efflux transporter MFP subunit